jgi:hypothetical protein
VAADAPLTTGAPHVVRAAQLNQLVRWFGRVNAPRAALAALRLLEGADGTAAAGAAVAAMPSSDASTSTSTSTSGSSTSGSSRSRRALSVPRFALPRPTAETYEFLANAFVKDVVLEGAANSMAKLPPPVPKDDTTARSDYGIASTKATAAAARGKAAAPTRKPPQKPRPAELLREVLFVGRSNAGKSSLVNMLVGRKVSPIRESDCY